MAVSDDTAVRDEVVYANQDVPVNYLNYRKKNGDD